MTLKIKVIVNALKVNPTKAQKLEQALKQAHLNYDLVWTRAPKHATELAQQATLDGYDIVVAAGGDGTINEVVNGLLRSDNAEARATLGIIPLGTANDLATVLKLPTDLAAACQRLAAGATQIIDVGQVNDHYFVNNSAVGLEPMVTLKQAEMRWLQGPLRYLVAAIQTVIQTHKAWQMRLDWPNGSYEGDVTLVSVGNSSLTGGVFKLTPLAKVDDGLIDFVCGMGMYRLTLLTLLPRVLTGSHITYSAVIYKQTSGLKIKAITPTPIQADGEIISEAATEICYKILPQRLKVIV